ncbi:unnamed protein product [Microthlaspi erraticum]|uniref:Uncharacterized protein n=1 Tax=Microthlaspi erraticum TaxID=1685480 RepID=A0A6D2IZR1_9BRAS|nr:unnamed protein product [Microthlaspi erraticum]
MADIVSAFCACFQGFQPVINDVGTRAGYISNFDDNLSKLRSALEDLIAKRDDVVCKVNAEEIKGHKQLNEVERWRSKVETVETNTNLLVAKASRQRRSTCGYCFINIFSAYSNGKKISKNLDEVQKLSSEKVSEVVTRQATLPVVIEQPVQQTFGLDTNLQRTWSCLMEDGVRTLGLHGVAGVGKTTLLTLIESEFVEVKGNFHVVIWVTVSEDVDIKMIQDDIGKKIGLYDDKWSTNSQREKACDIHRVLKTKPRFVLLLDDLRKEVNLSKIGIPVRGSEYKVVFTTRSRDVCESMPVNKVIEVERLAEAGALDLLKQNAGRETLDGEMLEHARCIVEKCLGLPLLLKVIGKSLSSKTTADEWHHVLCTMYEAMGDEVFPVLKYAFDNLKDDAKLCLKYCALFPEAYKISEDELVEYWIGEGIIDEEDGRKRAMDRGYDIIDTLVRADLLVEVDKSKQKLYMHGLICESKRKVYMHGLIREMALWIVVGDGERFVVKTGAGLSKLPKVKNWRTVTKMSLMNNEIKSITEYSQFPNPDRLVTLFLQNNKLVDIVGKFFLVLSTLVVLDMSHNPGIIELPDDISKLVSLRYLNLFGTRIKILQGLKDFIELIHLDLESTSNLQSTFDIQLISKLRKLQVLRFYGSTASLNLSLLKQLELMEDLEILTISVREEDVLEAFFGSKLSGKTQGLYLEGLNVSGQSFAATYGVLASLSKLGMTECNIIESEREWDDSRRNQHSPSPSSNQVTPCITLFKNLSAVELLSCEHLMDVTWLIYAENLESLSIKLSPKMEEVISGKKAAGDGVEPFINLQVLDLGYLNALESIYWSPLSFPRLQKVRITNCQELRKLPLNSTSVDKIDDLIIEMDQGWLDRIEWESGAEDRFRHLIRTASVSQTDSVIYIYFLCASFH